MAKLILSQEYENNLEDVHLYLNKVSYNFSLSNVTFSLICLYFYDKKARDIINITHKSDHPIYEMINQII